MRHNVGTTTVELHEQRQAVARAYDACAARWRRLFNVTDLRVSVYAPGYGERGGTNFTLSMHPEQRNDHPATAHTVLASQTALQTTCMRLNQIALQPPAAGPAARQLYECIHYWQAHHDFGPKDPAAQRPARQGARWIGALFVGTPDVELHYAGGYDPLGVPALRVRVQGQPVETGRVSGAVTVVGGTSAETYAAVLAFARVADTHEYAAQLCDTWAHRAHARHDVEWSVDPAWLPRVTPAAQRKLVCACPQWLSLVPPEVQAQAALDMLEEQP